MRRAQLEVEEVGRCGGFPVIVDKPAPWPRIVATGALVAGSFLVAAGAAAQAVVTCRSIDDHYIECPASDFTLPQLVYQISRRACVVNRTWGFDRDRGILWVDDGCAGRFADVGGYHHGRTGQFDPGARRYTAHGRDAGPFVGGQALGALLEGDSPAPAGGGGDAARRSNGSPDAPATAGSKPAEAAGQDAPRHAQQPDVGGAAQSAAPATNQPQGNAGGSER